jgi:hypothetical protein
MKHMSNRESISGTRLNETPIFTNTYRRAVVTMGIKDLWSQALGNIKKKDEYAPTRSCWPYFKVIIVCWLMKGLLLIIALMVFIIP